MIDVKMQSFGRELMLMLLGVAKYKAVETQKKIQLIKKQNEAIESLKIEEEKWDDISFGMTSNMIDKRYKGSKEFIRSGGVVTDSLKYKTSVTKDDKRFQYVAKQNMLKARTKYDSAVSSMNKRIADQKIKATFKLSDLKKVM